jgi:glycosyltransferase involved in cell wall biosynthesis
MSQSSQRPAPAVTLVLPCLDEAGALPWLMTRLPAGVSALVVDNGSTDGSPEIAARLGATVITEARRGYGAACHAGLLAADTPLVAFCDADRSLDPADLVAMIDAVAAGDADLAVCRRRLEPGAMPWHLRLANRELARRLRARTGFDLHDMGPMRVARREALLSLDLTDRRSGYPAQILVRAADAGWRVTEVEVAYSPRTGRSKVTGTPLGALRAVRDISAAMVR